MFPSQLTSDNKTDYRAGGTHIPLIATCDPAEIFQGQPSANASGLANDTITFSSISNYAECLQDMVFVISPSTDWKGDLRDNPNGVNVGHVRSGSTSTTLAVGRNSFQWTTSSYVTVLAWFIPMEKPVAQNSDGEALHNSTVEYTPPKPRITGVQASFAKITTGSNVSFSFDSPAVSIMNPSASSGTWNWITIAPDGTVTSGAGGGDTASPSFTLTEGWWWIIAQHTDDASTLGQVAVPVVVFDTSYTNDVLFDGLVGGSITRNSDTGNTCTLDAVSDTSEWFMGMPMMVIQHSNYQVGTANEEQEESVMFYGWLNNKPRDERIATDSGYQWSYSATFGDVAYFLALYNLTGFEFDYASSPTQWTAPYQLARVSPADVTWQLYSEFFTQCACMTWYSDALDYQFYPMRVESGLAWDTMMQVMARSGGATPQMSASGEIEYAIAGSILTSDSERDALTTVTTFTGQDHFSINPNAEYSGVMSQVYVGAGHMLDAKEPNILNAIAPALWLPEGFRISKDGFILDKDLSASDALTEAGRLAYNWFDYLRNVSNIVDVDLVPAYALVQPQRDAWYKFDQTNTLTPSGITFESSTRFECVQVNISFDIPNFTFSVTATLREETGNEDNFAKLAYRVPTDIDYDYQLVSGRDDVWGADDDLFDNYPSDSPVFRGDTTLPPEIRESVKPAGGDWYLYNVPYTGEEITTAITMANGTEYEFYVKQPTLGAIRPVVASGNYADPLTTALGSKTRLIDDDRFINTSPTVTNTITSVGAYSPVSGEDTFGCVTGAQFHFPLAVNKTKAAAYAVVDLGFEATVTSVSFRHRQANYTGGQTCDRLISYYDGDGDYITGAYTNVAASTTWRTHSNGSTINNVRYISLAIDLTLTGSQVAYIDTISVDYESSAIVYADATSHKTGIGGVQVGFNSGDGLLWGSSGAMGNPSGGTWSPQPTNTNRGFGTATASHDGNLMKLRFNDPDNDYTNNRNIYPALGIPLWIRARS